MELHHHTHWHLSLCFSNTGNLLHSYWYWYVCMSVFESPPCCSTRMDQDQTYNLALQLSGKMPWMICYIGFICKVMIQTFQNMMLKGTNCDDELIHLYMPWKALLVFWEELVATLFLMYIHTIQALQWINKSTSANCCPWDEYNQFNLQKINALTPTKLK